MTYSHNSKKNIESTQNQKSNNDTNTFKAKSRQLDKIITKK